MFFLTPKTYNLKANFGFSLIEVLLVVSSIAILAGISIPIYQSFQTRNDLDIAVTTIAQSLRRAQVLAQASAGDISYGVRVQTGSITIFKGINYSGRDTSSDELFDMPKNITITPNGFFEIVFAKMTGLPMGSGSFTLTSSTNESRIITINSKGMVSY